MHLPAAPTGTDLSGLCSDLTAPNWALHAPCLTCYAELNHVMENLSLFLKVILFLCSGDLIQRDFSKGFAEM